MNQLKNVLTLTIKDGHTCITCLVLCLNEALSSEVCHVNIEKNNYKNWSVQT